VPQETTLLGLLDMSAAFDTIDFEFLLRRLETSYRLNGTVLQWLFSFVNGNFKMAPLNIGYIFNFISPKGSKYKNKHKLVNS